MSPPVQRTQPNNWCVRSHVATRCLRAASKAYRLLRIRTHRGVHLREPPSPSSASPRARHSSALLVSSGRHVEDKARALWERTVRRPTRRERRKTHHAPLERKGEMGGDVYGLKQRTAVITEALSHSPLASGLLAATRCCFAGYSRRPYYREPDVARPPNVFLVWVVCGLSVWVSATIPEEIADGQKRKAGVCSKWLVIYKSDCFVVVREQR